jgi:hypothetical protein
MLLHSQKQLCNWNKAPYRNLRHGDRWWLFEIIRKTIVWKKVHNIHYPNSYKEIIIPLTLPIGTIIHMGWSIYRKCRANQAIVDDIGPRIYRAGWPCKNFYYRSFSFVFPQNKFNTSLEECGSGIHFFFTKEDAESWTF